MGAPGRVGGLLLNANRVLEAELFEGLVPLQNARFHGVAIFEWDVFV